MKTVLDSDWSKMPEEHQKRAARVASLHKAIINVAEHEDGIIAANALLNALGDVILTLSNPSDMARRAADDLVMMVNINVAQSKVQ
jgi:hypothetical protein